MKTNESELPTLFISYNWSDGNDCADELYEQLKSDFKIVRDKLDLSIMDGLTKFMERINSTDFAIVILTDMYLKALNCMYEATYLAGQNDWTKRTLILVIDKTIYKTDKKIEVLNYWKEKYDSIQEFKSTDLYVKGLELDEKKLETIHENIGLFLQVMTDSKNPSEIAIVNETIKMKESKSNLAAKQINNDIEERILDYLKSNPNSNFRNIAKKLGITSSYCMRIIKLLERSGRVEIQSEGGRILYCIKENS